MKLLILWVAGADGVVDSATQLHSSPIKHRDLALLGLMAPYGRGYAGADHLPNADPTGLRSVED